MGQIDEPAPKAAIGLSHAIGVDERRIQANLLVRFAQRRLDRRLAVVAPPARQGDLAAVDPHRE